MASVDGFEDSLNNFVYSHTREKSYLDLTKKNVVELRPLGKKGSVSLGVFWVHVLQHPNNYPVYSYPYKKMYRAGRQYELQLRIDGLTVIINLASGCFIIKGPHAIDWFVSCFPDIMKNYSSPIGSKSKQEQYTKEEIETLQKESEIYYKHYIENWPLEAFEKSTRLLMEAGNKRADYEPIDPEEFLKGTDLETFNPISDLLEVQETKEQLQKLEEGHVIQGHVLYRLWRSTLDYWFSEKNGRVYIITPHIDRDRFSDICRLFLKHKLTACLDTMCVPLSSLYGKFADVRRETIKSFSPEDQIFIEYKVLNNVIYPVTDFTTSFIALIKAGKVNVLQTNTNFDKTNFLTTTSVTVAYKEIDEHHFTEAYLNPILK